MPIQEFRYGKLTGKTFSTAEEAMSHYRTIKQEREDIKKPREVKE